MNIINQNKEHCLARAQIKVDDEEYIIERTSKKYTKRLKGVETLEASTDLEFYKQDSLGSITGLNGTSRQDTDSNVRKHFGTIQDFLLTSMASQLDSLSFINEGSTKRKEYLAKFLDLEIFDKKFKIAKEESALAKSALKRLEGINFEEQIEIIKKEITKSELGIETNKAECRTMRLELSEISSKLSETTKKIDSVPAEIIDPVLTQQEIRKKERTILETSGKRSKLQIQLKEDEAKFANISDFLDKFQVESYKEKKRLIEEKKQELETIIADIRRTSEERDRNVKKYSLLEEVPCGTQYPSCRFIRDAHAADKLIQISEARIRDNSIVTNQLGSAIRDLNPGIVEDHLYKYEQLLQKKTDLATKIATAKLEIERSDNLLFKEQVELESLNNKNREYHENRDAIENLKQLLSELATSQKEARNKENQIEMCEERILRLHKKHGSLEEKLKHTKLQLREKKKLEEDFAAYHLLMTCCHPNGVSYEIIKNRLPFINEEIAKILTNIVEFEVFITNNEDKLDIFIKHPRHDARPLEMGSGAEKTIASMAIRLAFLSVSSLPKSDLFILDEPGTALDEENMEGFVRILEMIKGHFKTVILISHLDGLKDCVDLQINIEKKSGFASVNL